MKANNLQTQFGNIDVYLFDQILKGRIKQDDKILDAGCGSGRNLIYFLMNGFDVSAVDENQNSINYVKEMVNEFFPDLPLENFKTESVEDLPFSSNSFDFIISNAVLHFAQNKSQFENMLFKMWYVLKPNGILFIRLATDIGIESLVKEKENGVYYLPDGTERFLVNLESILNYTKQFNGKLIDPVKTTNVQNLRCMTTWVLQKK